MEFGISFANIVSYAGADGAVALAQGAEAAGFDSIWTVEHVLVPDGYESEYPYDPSGRMPGDGMADMPDPLVWLAFLAQATTTLKLGTGILIVPQRNPAILAKEVATLHSLSGGRVLLGVGAGWLEEEFDALGVPFARRGARLEEHIAVMRALWSQDKASFDGEFTRFTDAVSLPKPPGGSVPIVIGGHTDVAARRAGRMGDGFFPGRGDPADLARLLATMRRAATDAGRDPDTIEVTAGFAGLAADDPLAELAALADLGVHRVVVPPLTFNPAKIADRLAQFGRDIIGPAS